MNLETIKDFQAFLGELLEDEQEKKLEGVRPITHGLGLESPLQKKAVTEPVVSPKPKADVHTPRRVATPSATPTPVPPPFQSKN